MCDENQFQRQEKIHSFNLKNVVLKDSPFKRQFDHMVKYYLAIPNDDLLYGFRKRAGDPNPGTELGGWYNNDLSFTPDFDEIFNTFPQWLSGLARIYSVTGDKNVYDKVVYLMNEWSDAIEADGYFYYSNNCNSLNYTYDKFLSALLDIYLYCKNENAKTHMQCITNWAEKNLERTRTNSTEEIENGGNPLSCRTDNEWYTLSENLFRAYMATGNDKYKAFAQVWQYDFFWNNISQGNIDKITGLHAYSHINSICGAAAAFGVTGDQGYLDIIRNAYKTIQDTQLMASGGYGPNERLVASKEALYRLLGICCNSFEVSCGSWAGFKLAGYLLKYTGEAHYGAWIESLFYNAIGAALPIKDDKIRRGKTYYYADYRLTGGRKTYNVRESYTCCSGTYPLVITEYHNIIYYRDSDCLYINLIVPSTVVTNFNNTDVIIEQTAQFPLEDNGLFTVHCQMMARFNIKIRIPSWSSSHEIKVSVNGINRFLTGVESGWGMIRGPWNDGDKIVIQVPMSLRLIAISEKHPERCALMFGPALLAIAGNQGGPLVGDRNNLAKWITRIDKHNLHFIAKDAVGSERLFVMFSEIPEKEKYFVYNDFV